MQASNVQALTLKARFLGAEKHLDEALKAAQAVIAGSDYGRKLAGGKDFFAKTDSVSFKQACQLGETEWLSE